MSEMGYLGHMGLFLGFSENIFRQILKNAAVWMEIFALHLSFRGLPGRTGGVSAAPFDDEKMCGIPRTCGVKKEAGSQIHPPSFGRVLHIGVGFHWIMGKMSGSTTEAWLKYIKERRFHLLRPWVFKIIVE